MLERTSSEIGRHSEALDLFLVHDVDLFFDDVWELLGTLAYVGWSLDVSGHLQGSRILILINLKRTRVHLKL